MTKQEALGRLRGARSATDDEVAQRIMVAIEHGATVAEVATELEATAERIERAFSAAISEAGRIGHVRHSTSPPVVTDSPQRLYTGAAWR